MNQVVTVKGDQPYDVTIGRALLGEVPVALGGAKRVLVINPKALTESGDALVEFLKESGFEAYQAIVDDGESAKKIEVAAFCWRIMGQADFTRSDAVIGFGGGAVTDLAGFVAATWLRGVPVIQIPTTLLAMVDASVGGKTGINTDEGKNLVGAFHAPKAVIADLDTLATLPRNELITGFAEVVKCGFIADERILEIIEADVAKATDPLSDEFAELIFRAVSVKARVVGEDFKENGLREILNYGHTLGHAIELAENFTWRHGAAISVGMMFVAELARMHGRLSDAAVERHRKILTSLGLPTTYRADRWQKLVTGMQRDKKNRGSTARFVVLDDIAKPTIMTAPTTESLFSAFQEICE